MVTPRQPDLHLLRNFLLLQYSDSPEDALAATPLIAALHAAIPEACVAVTASGSALDVFSSTPGVDHLLRTPSPTTSVTAAARALRSARPFGREHYTVLLPLGNDTPRTLLTAILGASPTRVGFAQSTGLVTLSIRYDDRLSDIANNLSIIAALGHSAELLEALRSDPTLIEPWSAPLHPSA
jgi:ADP-heptose:LPS heptosyltransferase